VAVLLFAIGCASPFSSFDPEFDLKRADMYSVGIAVLPPDIVFVKKTVSGGESDMESQQQVARNVRAAVEQVLTEGGMRVVPAGLAADALLADPELALTLTRCSRSFASACRAAPESPSENGGMVSLGLSPDVGRFAERTGTDYLVLVRGNAYDSSDGARALNNFMSLAFAIITDADSMEAQQTQGLQLEIGVVEASTARVIWYSRTEGDSGYNPLDLESVTRLCGVLLSGLTRPSPHPLDQHGAIGISVQARDRDTGGSDVAATDVYFVRSGDGDDLMSQSVYLRSNHSDGSRVYLLNAKPGRYAAIACISRNTAIFPTRMIRLTEVTVVPGEFAFMGDFLIETSSTWSHASDNEVDDAQLHYRKVVAQNSEADRSWLHEAKRGEEAERRFFGNAVKDFKRSGWSVIAQRELEASEPAQLAVGNAP
jgi:hypothetical protein